jgi:hypothetical protein
MPKISVYQADKELLKEISQNSLSPIFRQRATCIGIKFRFNCSTIIQIF